MLFLLDTLQSLWVVCNMTMPDSKRLDTRSSTCCILTELAMVTSICLLESKCVGAAFTVFSVLIWEYFFKEIVIK